MPSNAMAMIPRNEGTGCHGYDATPHAIDGLRVES